MKNAFLNSSINIIKNNNPNISETKMLEIRYGLENLFLSITKLIIILIISILLGIVKEFILFLLFYNIIRLFAFGMHASKTYICLIASGIVFLFLPYISTIITIPLYLKIILCAFCLLMIILYAPADTHKRPLIRAKKRLIFKSLSIIICSTFILLTFVLKNNFLSNCFLLSMLTEVVLILPITYKLFKLPYRNYLNYVPKNT